MNKYSAINGCPKCGTLVTFDRYFEDYKQIRRKCTRCDFLWWEEPLDSIVESAPSTSTNLTSHFPTLEECLKEIEREILKEEIENE